VRASDIADFDIDLKSNRVALVNAAVEAANALISPLSVYKTASIKQKLCAYYDDYSSVLILRAISTYLLRRFRLNLPNRDRIVASVIEAMGDSTPFSVVRRDLSSFYENVPTEEIRTRLLYDTAIPRQMRHHLKAFFAAHCKSDTHGLPRGVGLSTVLVELAMQGFDASVRQSGGVFRYFRYSDDILVFTFLDPSIVSNSLENLVIHPMSFNDSKGMTVSFSPDATSAAEDHFDYLGYRFLAATKAGGSDPRTVEVSISPSKIDRIKGRVILSVKDCIKTGNAALFIRRMRYLSGNHKISRTPEFFFKEKRRVNIGIYFNYKHCGIYKKRKHEEIERSELKALDGFYHSLCFGAGSSLSGKLAAKLNPTQRAFLRRISFSKGYSRRVSARVANGTIRSMKAAWRNH